MDVIIHLGSLKESIDKVTKWKEAEVIYGIFWQLFPSSSSFLTFCLGIPRFFSPFYYFDYYILNYLRKLNNYLIVFFLFLQYLPRPVKQLIGKKKSENIFYLFFPLHCEMCCQGKEGISFSHYACDIMTQKIFIYFFYLYNFCCSS